MLHNFHVYFGPPGTGKTTTLTRLIREYRDREGEDTLFVCSLTKAAAAELAGRDLDLPERTLGTLHSHCFNALGRPTLTQKKVKEWNALYPHSPLSASGHGVEERPVDGVRSKLAGDLLLADYDLARTTLTPVSHPLTRDFAAHWEDWKQQCGYMDFTDLLLHAREGLPIAPGNPETIIIDEAQDLTPLQWQLLAQWSRHATRTIAAGDDDQCQPAGTLVDTATGEVDIADLDPTQHTLLTYAQADAAIYGYRNRRYPFAKAERYVHGRLYEVQAGGRTTFSTPEHQWLTRWNMTQAQDAHVVYLMQQGERWRVGWCKLFRHDGTLHLGVRARLEQADATWVLLVTRSRTEASLYEQWVSVTYGIPTITFRPVPGANHMTADAIAWLFHRVKDLPAHAIQALLDHGRSVTAPLWSRAVAFAKQGGAQIFRVQTTNLLPGLMLLPVRTSPSTVSWQPVSLRTRPFAGTVYSLDVPPYHTYIADGIVTHNCLYRWCGADPSPLLAVDDSQKTVLPTSYRLPSEVWTHAQHYLRAIETRQPKAWIPRPSRGHMGWSNAWWHVPESYYGQLVEAMGEPWGTFAVITTCSYMLDPLVRLLKAEGMPYHNPWRLSRGDWNPLAPAARGINAKTRLLDFVRPQDRLWTWPELSTWLPLVRVRGTLHEGAKDLLKHHTEDTRPATLDDLRQVFLPEALDGALKGGIDWLEPRMLATAPKTMAYVLRVVRRHGLQALLDIPRLILGTAHSLKGAEADQVLLFRDLSRAAQLALMSGGHAADDVHRTLYVGATRAREALYVAGA